MRTSPWSSKARCANCMAHCGYEPTAVFSTLGSLKQSLRALRAS
ncbi:DUF3463 domain-containing protein [Actinomadura sp. NBRC 104412]|nr:DUF3463 domain-containing protein [Actinomadura sp. NBRC 104412]